MEQKGERDCGLRKGTGHGAWGIEEYSDQQAGGSHFN
jgi:hypothetical protein